MRLAQTSGKPIAQMARELGISDTSILQWRKELALDGPEAFPGKGHQTAMEKENRRLKRELGRVQQERDILKKVWASFRGDPDEISIYRTMQARIPDHRHVSSARRLGKRLLRLAKACSLYLKSGFYSHRTQ